MPTPEARILASEQVTQAIIRYRLLGIYATQYNRFKADLLSRLRIKNLGKAWGGAENPAFYARGIRDSMKWLEKEICSHGFAKSTVESIGGMMDNAFIKENDAFLKLQAGAAPDWVKAATPDLYAQFKTYLTKGSLVESKLLEGAYWKGGISSEHAKLYERTRRYLQLNLKSRKNTVEILTDIEKNVWNIDYAKEGANPRALRWIKRLIRTEYQYAHNSARHDVARGDKRIIGYEIILAPGACDICVLEYGDGPYLYAKDGEKCPPSESHPNCHCTMGAFVWARQGGPAAAILL